jgi:hypothetical protein
LPDNHRGYNLSGELPFQGRAAAFGWMLQINKKGRWKKEKGRKDVSVIRCP